VVVMLVGPFTSTAILLTVAEILPLVLRRVRPTLSFTLVAGAMAVQVLVNDVPVWGQVAMPVAVYSVAAYAPRSHSRIALTVALLGGVVGPVDWWLALGDADARSQLAGILLATELLVIAPWALGTLARTRRAYVTELIDRGHRLELQAAQRAELAASEERARIAREMHDVVAHGLSMMIVAADGASYAVRRDPAAATRALETISATGRESLAEMRRMLGLLRADDEGTGSRPQPGAADLGYLVAQSRASGMELTTDIADPLPALPSGVGLTVYRIVQEALTNTLKHAGPGVTASVDLRLAQDSVRIQVDDDGRGGTAADDGLGHGILGIRERIAVHAGEVEAGPRPGGGFRVKAVVPVAT
jgi:signal transduction histidine kinase